jgi:hypothetical protein
MVMQLAWMLNPAPTPNPWMGSRMAREISEGKPATLFASNSTATPRRRRKTKGRKRNMALYRTKSGRFTTRKTSRRVRSGGKRRRRRRNPIATATAPRKANPRRRRTTRRRRRRNVAANRHVRGRLYQVRGGYRGKKRASTGRRWRGGMYTAKRRINPKRRRRRNPTSRRSNPRRVRSRRYYSNPRRRRRRYNARRRNPRRNPSSIMGALKGTWRDLTSMKSLAQFAAGGIGILVANTGGGWVASKIREWTQSEMLDKGVAGEPNFIGIAFESAIKIGTVSVASVFVPSKYRNSFMIGGAATALWDLIKVGLLQYAPAFSAQIGLSGWLTDGELRQLGLSGSPGSSGMGAWLTDGQVSSLALRAPNPTHIRLPQRQFSGA